MPDPPEETANRPRLNPFAFAVDTDTRLVLLVVAVLTTWFLICSSFYLRFPEIRDLHTAIEAACTARAEALASAGAFEPSAAQAAVDECVAPANAVRAQGQGLGTVALLATVFVLYLAYPSWILRRRKLRPLSAEEVDSLAGDLTELRHSIELDHWPTFVRNPSDRSGRALAFGHAGRYYVALGQRLLDSRKSDPDAFRAIVAHELAHIYNRDVDGAYFTVALWRCFAVAVLLWIVVTSISPAVIDSLHYDVRLGAFAFVVYLTHAAVLRARELYADVRASTSPRIRESLLRILSRFPSTSRRFEPLWLHPKPATRARVIESPDLLFAIDPFVAFATGIVAASVSDALTYIVASFFQWDSLLLDFIGSAGAAALLVSIIGLGIWRASFAGVVRGTSLRLPRIALAAGLGWSVGLQLTVAEAAFATDKLFTHLSGLPAVLLEVICAALGVGAISMIVGWIGATATAWIPRALGRARATVAYVVALVVASGLLGFAFLIIVSLRRLRLNVEATTPERIVTEMSRVGQIPPDMAYLALLGAALLTAIANPFTFITAILAWAFPLAAAALPRRVVNLSTVTWAFLDRPPDEKITSRREDLRLRRVLMAGVVGGVILTVLTCVVIASALIVGPLVAVLAFFVLSILVVSLVAIWIVRPIHWLAVGQAACGTWLAATICSLAMVALVLVFMRNVELAAGLGITIWFTVADLGAIAALLLVPLTSASPRPSFGVPASPTPATGPA